MRSTECWSVLCLVFLTGAVAFKIDDGPSRTHQDITKTAILDATVRTCRSLAEAEGRDFTLPPSPLTVTSVIGACDAEESTKSFHEAIKVIQTNNQHVDIVHVFNAKYHFDDETFDGGMKLITDGVAIIKANNKLENFVAAREKLGEITHPLQDFYSHSNWVELGNVKPNKNLITAGTKIGNIDLNRPTCQNCIGKDCRKNIREDIIRDQILTSGYFGLLSSSKPAGKCSHGGRFDQSSNKEPLGGINKDELTAEHGHLHNAAADLATAATIQLLDDIRGAAGNTDFLRMVGISKGSNKALCFVIDTTGSMSDDIDAVKAVTTSLVDSKVGTRDEPSLYVLVPFNDPEFGPLMRTRDPNVFKSWLNDLTANGGGDFPELALSGLQLALTGAPPGSEIFLFTDATAKDIDLKDTVIALIQRTKTVVNFMLTGSFLFSFRRRREINGQNMGPTSRISSPEAQLFSDLAHASGGQAIKVSKSELSEATTIITESSAASLVTLLQAVRSPGRDETFSFPVDESVRSLTIYITGTLLNFTLTSPSGVSQSISSTNNSLATEKVVGNFRTLQIIPTVGIWKILLLSTNPYSIKIVGRSGVDFLFDFVQFFQGASEGFDVVGNRPAAGGNLTLHLTLTGSDLGSVTDVTLVEASGSGRVNGTVETLGGGDFLARFNTTPSGDFVVLVKGQTNSGTRASTAGFQRQSSTLLRASTLAITTTFNSGIIEPGSNFSVPFTVASNGSGGNYAIQATNDQGFASTFPSLLERDGGGSANGTVTLMAPLNTPTGTTVTLTIQAQAPGGTDTNFVVLRFSIVTRVTDNSRPVCQVTSLTANCTSDCSQSTWEVKANLTDTNSTGVQLLSLYQGNGTLNTSRVLGPDGENVTLVTYTASCCSPDFELVATDGAGNVGTCFRSIRNPGNATVAPPVTSSGTVAVACSSAESSKSFSQAISSITWKNILVDLRHPLNANFHFDNEMFLGGRTIIATGLIAVKASNRQGNFEAARDLLGEILHPLQDFYSHSNWVELGNRSPNPNLLRANAAIGNIAAETRATCRNCVGNDCTNNILGDVLQAKILTSGYFSVVPLFATKPKGKCSHGGSLDQSSRKEPKGGINKDSESASHGHLHRVAASLATAATVQLLADVGQAAGNKDFLRMVGIFRGSSKALCFVIATTASMRDDIEAVKAVTASLVNSKVGTSDEPAAYILVPFNDPGFRPLRRTTDPEAFKTQLNALTASCGGDSPEMSLSALKLALTGAPSDSEIFVFTDTSAKDTNLKSPVIALIERTKTVVNFMLTGTAEANSSSISRVSSPGALLYRQLAQTSGGLAIEVTKSELSEATSIITESSAASLVILLQASRSPGRDESFSISVDESVRSLTIYITGSSLSFTVTNPSGMSQSSTVQNGPLGVLRSVGNLQTLQLKTQVGDWTMKLVSSNPYTLKVIGQSDIDFLFDFVELSQGPFSGLEVLRARPGAGKNGTLLMSLTSSSAAITEVLLVDPFGSGEVNGRVEPRDGGDFLARFDTIPSGAFVVRVKGRTSTGAQAFQRQSPTNLRSSNVTVRSVSDNIIVPGTPFQVHFSVSTGDVGGSFAIQVTDDRGFVTDFPASLELADGGGANGTVTLSAPLNTPSGSDVTLTIQAESPAGADANYVVERYSIVHTVTDFRAPACTLIRLRGDCSGDCSAAAWDLIVDVSDPSGVGRVDLRRGNGSLSATGVGAGGRPTARVSYAASCCAPDVELLAVDGVGNVAVCPYSVKADPSGTAPSAGNTLTLSCLVWVGLGLILVCPAW
ncbi:unnamed protein product [Lota lota]